jgi:hypothetical protein
MCVISVEVVHKFVYFCVCLASQNEELQEIRSRIRTGNRAYVSILPLMKRRDTSWRVRVMLYKTFYCLTWQ